MISRPSDGPERAKERFPLKGMAIGLVLAIAAISQKHITALFSAHGKQNSGPPYAHPDVTPLSLLRTAYDLQPFYDIRREGSAEMFAQIKQEPSPMLRAAERYRNEGHRIEACAPNTGSLADIGAFIRWCKEKRLHDAADAAEAILRKAEANGQTNLPASQLMTF